MILKRDLQIILVSLISSSVSSETFSLSSLFDFSVDISILSDFAKEEPSEGDETFEAAITLELLAIDELFETENKQRINK